MKRNIKIALFISILLMLSGIILEFVIRTMSGDLIELRSLEYTLTSAGLLTSGLVIIGIILTYNQFRKREQ